jgi:hypothetical protein
MRNRPLDAAAAALNPITAAASALAPAPSCARPDGSSALATPVFLFPTLRLFAVGSIHRPRAAVHSAFHGRPHEEVTIRTSDGLDLPDSNDPARSGADVTAFPGRGGPVPHTLQA